MRDFLKDFSSPVVLSAVVLFGIAFNINLPDLGETYVSRNMFAWTAIFLLVAHLWWRPVRSGQIQWSPFWLISLFTPAVGFLIILAFNMLSGNGNYHSGHYFFPLMLLTFALLILGLLQYEWTEKTKFYVILAALFCFMPQFLIHLITANKVIFALLPIETLKLPRILYKPFAGFGQYNIYGSTHATLLVLAGAAFIYTDISKKALAALMLPVCLLVVDLPFSNSSTSLLGLTVGLAFLGAHVFLTTQEQKPKYRYLFYIGVLFLVFAIVTAITHASSTATIVNELSAEKTSFSLNVRLAMWTVGFWGFVEKPLFGHGLGSYLSIYMREFGEYGLAEGLTFYPNVTVPHNLIINVISETGLFGFAVLLGPFIWLAVEVLRKVDNRFLVLASLAPILVHTQLEYPYIASGTHYWLFAVALVFALGGQLKAERVFSLSGRPFNAQAVVLGGAALALASGIYMSISLALFASSAAGNYSRSLSMTVDELLTQRLTEPDLRHPVMGKRVEAITHIVLIRKAVQERRADVLRNVSVPALENLILPSFPTKQTWDIAFRVFVILNDRDRAMKLLRYIERYTPEKAAEYEALVRGRLKLQKPIRRPE